MLHQPGDERAQAIGRIVLAARLVERNPGVEVPADQQDLLLRLQHRLADEPEIIAAVDDERRAVGSGHPPAIAAGLEAEDAAFAAALRFGGHVVGTYLVPQPFQLPAPKEKQVAPRRSRRPAARHRRLYDPYRGAARDGRRAGRGLRPGGPAGQDRADPDGPEHRLPQFRGAGSGQSADQGGRADEPHLPQAAFGRESNHPSRDRAQPAPAEGGPARHVRSSFRAVGHARREPSLLRRRDDAGGGGLLSEGPDQGRARLLSRAPIRARRKRLPAAIRW